MYMSKLFLFAAFKSDKWSSYIVTRVEKFTQKTQFLADNDGTS